MIKKLTEAIAAGTPLDEEGVRTACAFLLNGENSIEERAAFLDTLKTRGETVEEIAAFVTVLLEHAVPVPFSGAGCIDVCGTGGDKAGFFNVSSAVMFVAAACGARVIKHGNRGITSKSGGADVLEALGVNVNLPPDRAAAALESAGCCFLFAPNYHPAFKEVAPVRAFLAKQGKSSIFNMLGPLLNPARPSFQLSGVFDPSLLPIYAGVFSLLGRERAWAVHGTGPDGLRLDEVSPLGTTRVTAVTAQDQSEFTIEPDRFGISPLPASTFLGGDASENAAIIVDILAGNLREGPRAIVQLNAAAALVVSGIANDLPDGWSRAGAAIDDGSARAVLNRLRASI